MSTAAIAIDNFLDIDKWNIIQSGISEYLNSSEYSENRTSLHTQINSWIKEKLMSLNLWQYAWEDDIKLFSSLNVLPKRDGTIIFWLNWVILTLIDLPSFTSLPDAGNCSITIFGFKSFVKIVSATTTSIPSDFDN